MTTRRRRAWFLFATGSLLGACLNPSREPCAGVVCSAPETCDPADGKCKCGGVVCGPGIPCDATTGHCVMEPRCMGVMCTGGSSVDLSDCQCKCMGEVCGVGDLCVGGDDGGCQPDPCYGVHCAGADQGIQCIEAVCRCGKNGVVTVDDPVCSRIQTCQDGVCVSIVNCDTVPPCDGGYEVCSPQDLMCHCGTTSGPVCGPDNPCELFGPDGGQFFACRAGDGCHQTTCSNGAICDPSVNYRCVCEAAAGLGGPICMQNEYCLALNSSQPPACHPMCNPYVQPECQGVDGGDAGALNCYAELGANAAICEPGNQSPIEGGPCNTNQDCGPGMGCWTHAPNVNGDAGAVISTCQPYCDLPTIATCSLNDPACPCVAPQYCTPVAQVQATGQVIQVGFCQ